MAKLPSLSSGNRCSETAASTEQPRLLGGRAVAVEPTMIYQIAGIGIVIAILNIFLAQAGRQEQAQMLSLAGVVIVLLWLVQLIARLFRDVEAVFRWW